MSYKISGTKSETASAADATDFGDLTQKRSGAAACSSSTRGVFAGGDIPFPGGFSNVIDYVTISSTGNATNFGDLTDERGFFGGCSDGHGGLG